MKWKIAKEEDVQKFMGASTIVGSQEFVNGCLKRVVFIDKEGNEIFTISMESYSMVFLLPETTTLYKLSGVPDSIVSHIRRVFHSEEAALTWASNLKGVEYSRDLFTVTPFETPNPESFFRDDSSNVR